MQKKTKQTYWRKKERRSKKIWRNGRGVTICSDHRVLDVIDVNDEKNSNTHSLPTIPLNNETRQMIQEKVVAEYETITGRTWYKTQAKGVAGTNMSKHRRIYIVTLAAMLIMPPCAFCMGANALAVQRYKNPPAGNESLASY